MNAQVRGALLDTAREVVAVALAQGESIVLYRQPGTQEASLLIGLAQKITDPQLPNEPGFFIAPFQHSEHYPHVWLRGEARSFEDFTATKAYTTTSSSLSWHTVSHGDALPSASQAEQSYKMLVRAAMDTILQGKAQKIVTSRRWTIPTPHLFDLLELWSRVALAYPDAFVSLVSTPYTGTWLCASPELLVSEDAAGVFRTVALAGTQPALEGLRSAEALWTHKEIEEQALVSRYIIQAFKQLRLREFVEDGPFTTQAAHLLHLKSTFEVDTVATNRPFLLQDMLHLLHPTSAVCGMPREAALNFLHDHESYDRAYYAGFVGPVNQNTGTALYVQLRCMQHVEKYIHLYAGGGITAQSDVEKEWKETEYKLQTLSSLLTA